MTDAFASTTPDPVTDLVGEGKKFKTVEDLAKGKLEADAFIDQLKREAAELRKELGTKVDTEKALEDLRTEFRQLKESKPAPSPQPHTTASVSESDLEALIAKTITESEARKTATQNIVSANNAVVRHYGTVEKAQEALRTKATELGLSLDELKRTASQSPTAFLKLVLPEVAKADGGNFLGNSVNTAALEHTPGAGEPKEGTKEFYDALRAKNPKRYFSPEVQNAIFKAAMAGTYDYQAGLSRG